MDPYETMNGKTNTSQEESLLCWVEIFRILQILLTLAKIYTWKIILLSSFAMVGFTARRLLTLPGPTWDQVALYHLKGQLHVALFFLFCDNV